MQVKEILRVKGSRLVSIEPSGRAADAVSTMAKDNLGSLVVIDQGRMVGMLTFHELLQAVAKRSGSLGEVRVSDIMQKDPVTATPEKVFRWCAAKYTIGVVTRPMSITSTPAC